jgi:CheY-like chemotaxis protein
MVLLDLGLPTIDGYMACQSMRERGLKEATIIAITGYGEAESRQRSKAAGFDAHLVKPISASALDPYLRAVRASQR